MSDFAQPRLTLGRVTIHATLLLACAVYLVPLIVMLLTSFKTPEDIRTGNLLSWPEAFTAMGWLTAWDAVGGYFWNSVKIVIPAVLISTALGAINGYVLSMWRFRGSQLFFGLLLFGCFLPFQVILLPASFSAIQRQGVAFCPVAEGDAMPLSLGVIYPPHQAESVQQWLSLLDGILATG